MQGWRGFTGRELRRKGLYLESLVQLSQRANSQAPFVLERNEDPNDKDRWSLKKMSQFTKGHGLDIVTKLIPFLLPHPHNS